MPSWPPVIAIVGPTAVGKSRLALQLAPELGADIVSADSRQVYRYMDIGTAKATVEERAAVPHYMLDLVEPSETYSVQRFREEGLRVLRRVACDGHVAFVVGGTGYYIRALLDGLSVPRVPPDEELRRRLRSEAEADGAQRLHDRLASLDPSSATRIHANNVPRVIRALEILEHTGAPVEEQKSKAEIPALYIGVTTERTKLRAIADRRVLDQVRAGLVTETDYLLGMGYGADAPAMSGFGYRQMVTYLNGECTLQEAISSYQMATHQYIRRQFTWFRADRRVNWFDSLESPQIEVREVIERWLSAYRE